MEQRKELAYKRHTLPSRFWEPEPDEDLSFPKTDMSAWMVLTKQREN